MSDKVKETYINRTYYFFNYIINIENFDQNIKMNETLYKNILYWKNSKYVKIYSANPLYLIFSNVNGYFEENNGNKYLTLVPTNENKEKKLKILRTVN